jgi:hypothetical protein
MADLPPGYTLLPPDAEIDPPPGAPPPGQPGATTPPLPPGYATLPPGAQPDAPQQPYQSTIWPVRTTPSGGWQWDPHAGLLGSALDAFTLPGDVLTGKQPTPYTGGSATADPTLLQRAENLVTFISPTSTASRVGISPASKIGTSPPGPETRVGDLVPGMSASRVAPTGEELKASADAGYTAARASPATIPAGTVSSYGTALQQHLQNNFGLIPKTAPKTFDVLNDLANQSGPAKFIDLEAARRQLNAIKGTAMGDSDAFAAQQVIPHLDNLIDTISPEAATARANLAAAKRADAITGDLTQANTGILEKADTAAQLRQRVKTFIQSPDNVRGFTPEEISALDDFSKGSGAFSTALTKVGNVTSGIAGKVLGAGAGAYLGSEFGQHGAELGFLAGPWAGEGFKSWENARASAQLNAIGQQLRSRSPLGEQYLNQNARAPNSLLNRAVPPVSNSQFYTPPLPPAQAPGPVPQGSMWTPQGGPRPVAPLPTTGPIPAGLLGPWA